MRAVGVWAWVSVRNVITQTDPTVGIPAAVGALLVSLFYTQPNFLLFVLLLGAMTLDFVVALGRVYRTAAVFDRDRFLGGVVGKLMRIAVVVLAAIVDTAIASVLPSDAAALTPTTKVALAWMIAGEGFSVLARVHASEGDDAIPPLIIRALDRMRLRREPPTRRHYDEVALKLERELRTDISETTETGGTDEARIQDD